MDTYSHQVNLQQFVRWKQSDKDRGWYKKAVDFILKRLAGKEDSLDDLTNALSNPEDPSRCVTVEKNVNGTVKVAYRTGPPHIIFCRLWRWPDLKSDDELEPLEICKYPFTLGKKTVCINPYHYVRVGMEIPTIPAILVPKISKYPPDHTIESFQQAAPECSMPRNMTYSHNGLEDKNISSTSPMSSPSSLPSPRSSYMSQELHSQYGNSSESPSPSSEWYNNNQHPTLDSSSVNAESTEVTQVCYQELRFWSTISYYELNSRVGDVFNCQNQQIVVDGFTLPNSADRFCLGLLSNVNRNSTIEKTRRHIGRGVRFSYINGEVFAECLSEYPIFIQSPICNSFYGLDKKTVFKLVPGASLKIFSNQKFATLLQEAVQCGYEATYQMTTACLIRMSFVKGWGSDYHRYDVSSTPCWIELQLKGPLQWLDRILSGMGSPRFSIGSTS